MTCGTSTLDAVSVDLDMPDTRNHHLKNLAEPPITTNMGSPEINFPFATVRELHDMEERLTHLINKSHQDLCQKIHMSQCLTTCRSGPSQARDKKVASSVHTPLRVSMGEVLLAIQEKDYYKCPPSLSTRSRKQDITKYCAHHQVQGHDTESCRSLRHLIEDLIKIGELKEFVLTNPVNSARQIKESSDNLLGATSSTATSVEEYVPAFVSNAEREEPNSFKRMRHDNPSRLQNHSGEATSGSQILKSS